VHEVISPPHMADAGMTAHHIERLSKIHTTIEQVGRVATAAGVKTLVLSHLVPADDPQVTEAMWIDAARSQFKGEIVVARDLLEV